MLLRAKCPSALVILLSGVLIRYSYIYYTVLAESSVDVGLVSGIAGGVGGALLLIILVMAVLLIVLTVRIRKSGSQDISTATSTGTCKALIDTIYLAT